MKQLIIFICFISIVSILFALPITFSKMPEKEKKQADNSYTNKNDADFATTVKNDTKSEYVKFEGQVEHLFTHALLAFPELALSKKNPMSKYYAQDCITPLEFSKILESLYKKDYILIDINLLFENKNGKIEKKDLFIPKNKKPLILSFDDIVYDSKKSKTGMVDKVIIDANGNLATETKKTWDGNKTEISLTNDFIPILETFVKRNPNFSLNGAKGTICLTGFDGILGYRTSSRNKHNRNEEIINAKKIVKKLKQNGWNFACHSFGHYHMKKISDEKFLEDILLWKEEVEPLIGKTKVYIYPYGEWEIYDKQNNITKKHKILINNGFEFFCGVGSKNFFGKLPFANVKNKTLFMDRKALDGFTITSNPKYTSHLFDSSKIVDKRRFI